MCIYYETNTCSFLRAMSRSPFIWWHKQNLLRTCIKIITINQTPQSPAARWYRVYISILSPLTYYMGAAKWVAALWKCDNYKKEALKSRCGGGALESLSWRYWEQQLWLNPLIINNKRLEKSFIKQSASLVSGRLAGFLNDFLCKTAYIERACIVFVLRQ